MNKKLKFYNIEPSYIKYLKKFENKISDISSENFKNRRKFIGILIEIKNISYIAPLTSPKEKHANLKDTLDFLKIKEGEYGAINFNNMFPVPNELIKEFKIQDEQDIKYKFLLEKQLSWCNEEINKNKILKVSKNLYKLYIEEKLPEYVKNRCCDFKFLEKQCSKYLEKLKQEELKDLVKETIKKEIPKDNYNALTGNPIIAENHSSGDKRWIAMADIKDNNISVKDNENPTLTIVLYDENGKLHASPIEYYNVSQLEISKELEQKFVPMKEKEKNVEKSKDREIER